MSKLSTQEVWEIVHDASDEDVYDYLGGEFKEETREERNIREVNRCEDAATRFVRQYRRHL